MDNGPRLTRGKRRSTTVDANEFAVEDTKCVICLDTLKKQRDVTVLPCGHAFHSKCMMENILKNNLKCPMCRSVFAHVQVKEDSSDDGDMDENTIIAVADRIQKKLKKTDVDVCLSRFRIPNGTSGLSYRGRCELLAEQRTHETDDEAEASA